MNKLLQRQIAKYNGSTDELPDSVMKFLQTVSDSYDHYEKDRRLLERSIELSSMELKELNGKLKKETEEESKEVYRQLKDSLAIITKDDEVDIQSDFDNRKLSHMASIIKSETEKRKAAQIELNNSEIRFRSLIENSADGLMIIDEKSMTQYISASVTRILGYELADTVGKPLITYFHPEDREELMDVFRKIYSNPEQTYTTVYRVRRKDGTYIWIEGTSTNLLHISSVNGVVINFRDITERKKSKDALQETNNQLRKSNSELDRFVYSVSHDLRAPLSSMLGVVELIETEVTSEEMAVDINHLKSSIHRLDGFIKDILDYSRNTRTEVEPAEVNFSEKVNEVKQNLKYMSGNTYGVDVEVSLQESCTFYSDNMRLGIILNNIISNAIRYSDPKKNRQLVLVKAIINENKALITIEDNGIGISEENVPKMFEMFYRVSNKSEGSGLGLYIVKESVEKLQGKISVESNLGTGTKFTIELPNQKLINSHSLKKITHV